MLVEELLAKLKNVRRSGDGYEARCPAHDDQHASLSVSRGEDGRKLLFCHAGCATEDVASELGVSMADLMDNSDGMASGNGRSRIARTYDYEDELGELLFQVCRLEPKSFRQRRPADGGGWNWSVKGVRQVPYRLPELVAAEATEPVFVVEGEKDVDRLAGLGVVATCNAGGANKWRQSHSKALQGRQVVILPDNDGPGLKHANAVAASLQGVAASVRILELPDLPPKGDVSDWLDGGGTAGRLCEMVKSAQEWVPTEAESVNDPVNESGLPEIDAGCANLPNVTEKAWDALRAANDPPRIFRYGGRVVRIEQGDQREPVIRELTLDRMRYELAEAALWFKWKKRGDDFEKEEMSPPDKVVRNTLATPNIELPILSRIVEAPVFASDGSLQTEPGYHAASRTFYSPADGFTVPDVPEQPTPEDVEFAVDLLAYDLLGDFPFIGDSEKANVLALALLPFAAGLIDGCTPFHLVEKPCPGTGATLLVDSLAYLPLGRPVAAMTEGRDEDEWRKRITAKLRSGSTYILIDNLRRRLDSAAVSSAITSPTWEDRILGTSETIRVPVRCVWVATGNNPAVSSEIARRTVRIRLDARRDRPWLREEFRHLDLRLWIRENRGQLVWAALTLIRVWLAAGRPKGATRLGMFESWSETMGGILDVAKVPGFLENVDEFYDQSDAEGNATRALLGQWWDEFREKPVGVADLWKLTTRDAFPLDLGSGKERSQKSRLGRIIVGLRDRMFTIEDDVNTSGGEGAKFTRKLRIERAGTRQRATLWRLREIENNAGVNL